MNELGEELKSAVGSSRRKCCFMRFDDLIFGRTDQANRILMQTFDGKHIMLDGPDGNKIDCMFFPCTSKEEEIIDETATLDGNQTIVQRNCDFEDLVDQL